MIPKSSYPGDQKILRVVSINVNGLRSSVSKGLLEWIEQSDADVICMQESRITHAQWTDKFKPKGWYTHLFPAERPGYAGTAIYSRLPFVSITDGLGFELADSQGRFISAEFDLGLEKTAHICSLYLPSGSSGDEAQARKDHFLEEYKKILKQWRDEDKSIIVCGDYNIVHKRIDIKNWSGNQKASGCLPHERAGWIISMMNWVMSIRSAKSVKKPSCIPGGRIVVKPAPRTWAGGLTIRLAHRTGKTVL
jgi:exodeoxyribonuclease III (xth)